MRCALACVAVMTVLVGVEKARAVTQDLDTSTPANWVVSGGGATDAPPFAISGMPVGLPGALSITSNGQDSGTFAPGGTLSQFNGVYWLDEHFFLPADATGMTLQITGLWADDRVVALLNGTIIDSAGLWGQNFGSMTFRDGSVQDPFYFNRDSWQTDQSATTIATGFLVGGDNVLELIVNNTGSGIVGPAKTISGGDGTTVAMGATLTYDVVPEPSTLAMLFTLALGGLPLWRRRRCRNDSRR